MAHLRTFATAGVSAAALFAASPARAQEMVPPPGAGSVTIGYQTGLIDRHLLADRSVGGVRIRSHSVLADFSIGLGKNFGLGISLPLVTAKYEGAGPHVPNAGELLLHPDFTLLDDGKYHSAFQDFRFELRYALSHDGLHAMPFVTVILPSHNYEFLSHAAPGRRVREVRVGLAVHRLLDPLSARSYVHAHAAHAFQEEIAGVPRRATHLNVEGGYFVRPSLTVFGGLVFHVTHGGIDLFGDPRASLSGPLFINHDRIVRERMLNAGGGLAYSISDRYSVSASISRTLSGINGHAQAFVLNVGFSRSFGGPHGH